MSLLAGELVLASYRAIYLNDDWESFHTARIAAEQNRLYPYKADLPTLLGCAA